MSALRTMFPGCKCTKLLRIVNLLLVTSISELTEHCFALLTICTSNTMEEGAPSCRGRERSPLGAVRVAHDEMDMEPPSSSEVPLPAILARPSAQAAAAGVGGRQPPIAALAFSC